MRRRVAVIVLLAAAAAGCTSGGNGSSTKPQPNLGPRPDQALVTAANLRPCPQSAAAAVASSLPDVTLDCLGEGPAVHMAGLTGAPTVVNLWGSWCEPCQAEEKYLSSAYNHTRGTVRFLGVDTVDSANSALDFDAHVNPPVRFPSVFDPDKKVLLGLHFQGPPETLYLDRAGKIVHINRVPYTSTAAVTADIARYLHVAS